MSNWHPLFLSFYVAISAFMIVVIVGVLFARFMLGMREGWRIILESLCTLPLVLPPSVIGFLLLVLFGNQTGVGRWLQAAGIQVVFTPLGAIVAAVIVAFPLMYRATYGAFRQVDEEMVWAARTMGLTEWTILFKILIPQALPGMMSGALLAFARGLGEFGATLMIAGNIPGETQTMATAIYFATASGNLEEAALWSCIMIGVSFSMLYALNQFERKRR